MVKESGRKCSHCGHNGHNSRTCNGSTKPCVRLFGINLLRDNKDQNMKKCFSTGNLEACHAEHHAAVEAGYLSDGMLHSRRGRAIAHDRKKGKPWAEEEHRLFLLGLENKGKGDWKGIAREYVATRTPTQVASHAQKYFVRMAATDKKKRRSSLFDMSLEEVATSLKQAAPAAAPAPQDYPVLPTIKTAGTLSQASCSSAVPVKSTDEVPPQARSLTQLVNQFPSLHLDNPPVVSVAAAYGVPNYHVLPYMMGSPGNGQSFSEARFVPNAPFVPMINYARPGYLYMSQSYGNFATCAPVTAHPSGIPSPSSVPHGSPQAGTGTSSPVAKDHLELQIGQPQSPTQTSGAIRVI